jgi:NADPH:quinone reductase-like Zn-dependent oxidoreductase
MSSWTFTIDPTRNPRGPARIATRPPSAPGPGQVLVRMRAVSLNSRDMQMLDAALQGIIPPLVPLSDGAGEVIEVGTGVDRVQPGDRVVATFFTAWIGGDPPASILHIARGGDVDGLLSEYVLFDQQELVVVPEHLSFEEAATLPVAGVTAWHALVSKGRIRAGQRVLLLGTGGVSMFALQFARLHGAEVVITSSSDEKLERARTMGASITLNYRTTPDWGRQVFEMTGGVDHVIEVGGMGTLGQSLTAAGLGGQVNLIGVLDEAGDGGQPALLSMIKKMVTLRGIYGGSREMFEDMNLAIERCRLRPVIDRVFPQAEVDAAFEHLRGGRHMGKVVVTLDA